MRRAFARRWSTPPCCNDKFRNLADARAGQDGRPVGARPASAARISVGNTLCADEDRSHDHPAGYAGRGARLIGGGVLSVVVSFMGCKMPPLRDLLGRLL